MFFLNIINIQRSTRIIFPFSNYNSLIVQCILCILYNKIIENILVVSFLYDKRVQCMRSMYQLYCIILHIHLIIYNQGHLSGGWGRGGNLKKIVLKIILN